MLAAIQRSSAVHAFGVALLYVACAFMQSASAQSVGEIRVVAAHGDAQVQMGGVTAPLSANAVLQLPATIRTGVDGTVELRQGPTTIAVAGRTELLIPESAAVDGLIERVVQISGNAFYNVGKRETRKLRVETPHLVAIIKGTQFNVAAQPDTTTIALYEGLLEVRAADDSDVVELHPGEIAIRRRDQVSIRVLRTGAAAIDIPRTTAPVAASADARAAQSDAMPAVTRTVAIGRNSASAGGAASMELAASTTIDQPSVNSADLSVKPQGGASGWDVSANIESAAAVVDVDVGLGAGPIDAGIGTSVGLSDGGVDIGADVGLDAGTVTADIGASVGVDPGSIDVGVDVGAGAGPITTDVGLSAGLGGDAIGVGADVGVGAGNIGVDVGADVDALGGAAAVTADVDLGAVGSIDAGVDLGSQSPEINVDTQVGGLVGADVGLGADGPSIGVEVGGTGAVGAVGDVVEDTVGAVDDILGGLFRRRPRE